MQGRPGREGEEEEEGDLEPKPIHHASSQSAERQLPQHLQSRQETVVGRLKGERPPRGRRGTSDEKKMILKELVKKRNLRG